MAPGPGNLSRPVARRRHELGLTREQVAHRAGMAASGHPLLCQAPREPTAISLSFKPGEVETHERETDIMQAVQGRATVVTGEHKHTLGVSDVLVIPSGVPPPVRGRHRPVPLLRDNGTGMRLPRPPELMRGRPGQTHQTIGDAGRQVAPGLDWPMASSSPGTAGAARPSSVPCWPSAGRSRACLAAISGCVT